MLRFGNKGYLRTLEVMIAFIMTFSFLIIILNLNLKDSDKQPDSILEELTLDENFRNELGTLQNWCRYSNESSKLINITKENIKDYDFVICMNKKPELPRKSVVVDSAYITGNMTEIYEYNILKLYYWKH